MAQTSPVEILKAYSKVLGRKMGFIAIGWVVVYFISQPFRREGDLNVLMLFAPLIGALAGLVAGWYIATDAVEDSGLCGLPLWVLMVFGACFPMWAVEGIMHWIFRGWSFGFGGWMLLMFASLMALASAVWLESSQD
jgi:hypothetical protein